MAILTVFSAWLLADFISGLAHWWEDRAIVGVSRFDFINLIRADNERHHLLPSYFLKFSYWGNINTTAPASWAVSVLLFLVGVHPIIWLAFFFVGFGNLIHRLSHTPPGKLNKLIRVLQRTGFFISNSHHSGHHFKRGEVVSREMASQRYCVMTSWLNPILDRIGFFRLLEIVLVRRKTWQ